MTDRLTGARKRFEKAKAALEGAEQLADRTARIAVMIAKGRTYAEIGKAFGLSSQRVHQIAERNGLDRGRRLPERNKAIVADASAGMPMRELSGKYNLAQNRLYSILREHGMRVLDISQRRRDSEIASLIDRVRNGESYYSAAGGDPSLAERIRRVCLRTGVRSVHQSNNPKLRSPRTPPRADADAGLSPATATRPASFSPASGGEAGDPLRAHSPTHAAPGSSPSPQADPAHLLMTERASQ